MYNQFWNRWIDLRHYYTILSLVVAVISGAEGTCVQWEAAVEEGFVFLDLAVLSQSSNLLCFVRDIPR